MSDLQNPNYPESLKTTPTCDRRNLVDHFKYWKNEAIIAALDEQRHPFVLLLENFAYDFNISQAVRNSNAFLAREIWICGRRNWDKRGAVGTNHYEHIHNAPTSEEVVRAKREEGYRTVVFDNVAGAESLFDYQWQPKSLMIFGQEDIGVSPESIREADDVVYIPQFGSTRSLNVGCASGIAMYEYMRQRSAAQS